MTTIHINFEDESDAKEFMRFMDNQGEQTYWDYLDCREGRGYNIIINYDYDNLIIECKKVVAISQKEIF